MTLNIQTPSPIFGGSTGGWLRAAETEEKYAITWTSKKEQIQFLHPKDGVFPEKVNPGRVGVNNKDFSIGKNPNPIKVKFTGKGTFD